MYPVDVTGEEINGNEERLATLFVEYIWWRFTGLEK
jgi:hypothetical protein